MSTQKQTVLRGLIAAGDAGLTCAEAALLIDRPNAHASKVLSSLHREGLAEYALAEDARFTLTRGVTRGAIHLATTSSEDEM